MMLPRQIACVADSQCLSAMIDSGAGVTVCPERCSAEALSDVMLESLPADIPLTHSATGDRVRAIGHKSVDYALENDERITVSWIVTNVNCAIISANTLRSDGYSITLSPTRNVRSTIEGSDVYLKNAM